MGSLGQESDIPVMSKRIVVCCDGTWQSSVSGLKNVPSNVTRLARSIARSARDVDGKIWQQIVHYDAGIGTGDISKEEKDRQGGFGIGFIGNVIEAYNFIVLNYSKGDQIFCFGFSRGAYTARAVAGLVNDIGVISPRDLQDFPDLYRLYQENKDSHGFRKSRHYREWVNGALSDADSVASPVSPQTPRYGKSYHADAPEDSRVVQVVGVFDTVGSLGVPDLPWTVPHLNWLEKFLGIPDAGFHNVALSPYIRHAFHALALDEHRSPFSPTLWHFPPDGDLSTKKPRKSHDELHEDWKRIEHDPEATQQQIETTWGELIDSEMYEALKGTDSELLQVWFPGYHINIGGGSDDPLDEREGDFEQIALITFAWMCEQISPYIQLDKDIFNLAKNSLQDRYDLIACPLEPLPPTMLPKGGNDIGHWLKKRASSFLVKNGLKDSHKTVSEQVQFGWATGPIEDSFSGAMVLAGSRTRTPGRYNERNFDGVRIGKTYEMIHPTVWYRQERRPDYLPEALKGFKRQQASTKGFEWRNGSTAIPEYLIKPNDFFTRYIAAHNDLEGEANAFEFIRSIDKVVGEQPI
ncbi:hypothetical protein TruAng_002763 [Truncatella angustata]|nr:hypothetical protein TruAng_002763 [Truncatella angustata]